MKFSRGESQNCSQADDFCKKIDAGAISFCIDKGLDTMLTSLAIIFLAGLASAAICTRLRLPRIIGMLVVGVVTGPFVLDLLDPSVLGISADLRKIALIIILIKAGLALDVADLKRIGRPALLMSCLPALFEIAAYIVLAPLLLPVDRVEAALMGAVLGAVSPAVVVPRMVQLIEDRRGTGKRIPQLILAGASLDDVFVIVLFTSLLGMAQGQVVKLGAIAEVPVSIIAGIAAGAAAGWIVSLLFEEAHRRGASLRNSVKVVVTLGTAFLLMAAEGWLEGRVPMSGLLAVMSMACAVRLRCRRAVTDDLAKKYGKLWVASELLLFVLVGAALDIRYTLQAGAPAVLMILLALAVRSAGVLLSLQGTALNRRERLYCVIAYLPKATVQAAIGSVPLSMGLPCGNIVLSVAVLSILITAPLGALLMDAAAPGLLTKEE